MDKFWVDHFNFRFDPFEYEEASSDPNLNRYLIVHNAFSLAWSEAPALIFSPPGGGKTALRIYTGRACWTGAGGYQPFPIHYHLPRYFETSSFSTLDDHLQMIVRSMAQALFLSFLYYPLTFLKSSPSLQKHLVQFISTWIPDLKFYLKILCDTNSPDKIAARIDRSYILHQTPDHSLLRLLCDNFANHLSGDQAPISLSIEKVFEQVTTWIMRDLGFRAVYVLLDGVDGFPDLANSPSFAAQSLFNLFANIEAWGNKRIFLKGFLPTEIRGHLHLHLEEHWEKIGQVELKWDEIMLADMLRRRVYAAVGGEFASLAAVSTLPSIFDLELEIARTVYPLPREALVLVKRILFEYQQRWEENPHGEKRVYAEDVEQAINWYRMQQLNITDALASIAGGN